LYPFGPLAAGFTKQDGAAGRVLGQRYATVVDLDGKYADVGSRASY
jgi:hypothetical protein